jgi:hypothetical protein
MLIALEPIERTDGTTELTNYGAVKEDSVK